MRSSALRGVLFLGFWILAQGMAHALTCVESSPEARCIDKRVGFGAYGVGQEQGTNYGGYIAGDIGLWQQRFIARLATRFGVSGFAGDSAHGSVGMLAFAQPSIGLNLASAHAPITLELIAPLESMQVGALITTLFSLGVGASAHIRLGEILALESSMQYSYVAAGLHSVRKASLGDFGGSHQGFDQVADRAYKNFAHTSFSGAHRWQASLGIYMHTRVEYFARAICVVYALEEAQITGRYQNPSSLFVALEMGVGF